MTTRVVLTYRDYEALPGDGRRYEIHEGELSVTPAPSPQHQKLIGRLYRRLAYYWIVDPEARRIDVYRLAETAYALETTGSGAAPVTLPPLSDLALAPASLWG